ncbi:hypothetical protein NHQ30_011017 [Ciborinia camelliae]|nr:hypothetical protein NHQ30_011017 [Ciborinia camelliae]
MSDSNKNFLLSEVFNVKGKEVALVTGGGSGIGLMTIQALAVKEEPKSPSWAEPKKSSKKMSTNTTVKTLEQRSSPSLLTLPAKMRLQCTRRDRIPRAKSRTAEEMKKNLFDMRVRFLTIGAILTEPMFLNYSSRRWLSFLCVKMPWISSIDILEP